VKHGSAFLAFRPPLWATLLSAWLLLSCCAETIVWDSGEQSRPPVGDIQHLAAQVEADLLSTKPAPDGLTITSPYDNTLFPADIASPTITWIDRQALARRWLISLKFSSGRKPMFVLVAKTSWTPDGETWEAIKAHSRANDLKLAIHGLAEEGSFKVVSHQEITLRTSEDPVGDSIFFRQIPLPFAVASQSFEKTRWRLGDISSYGRPQTVMEGLAVCASCHAFSADGKKISMEYNFNNDNGAQFITDIKPEIVVTHQDLFSWSAYPRSGFIPPTRGLFGRMSPSGRFAAASVNEISYAAVMDDLAYSQLFFPTYGILAVYDTETGQIAALAGASDSRFVQANPTWSPDEKSLYFCRASSKNEVHADLRHVSTVVETRSIHQLNELHNIQFDIYRLPFNNGKGGVPEPVEGASANGMSNYFPRVSPDGQWLVYTRSRSGIMLQPDSELWIVAAAGGQPRRMQCNRPSFNSWHSWSSNGRWLLFSTKANGPYTEIFLTHVDREGNDTPPVRLERFNDPGYAANVPEFAPIAADAIRSLRVAEP
jgi:hypothetical protein